MDAATGDVSQPEAITQILPVYQSDFVSPVDDLLREQLFPAILLFRRKARDYSERSGIFTADLLGARGQFAEIWRKIPKLKKGMWDGDELVGETVTEILMDLLGHTLLSLGFVNKKPKMGMKTSAPEGTKLSEIKGSFHSTLVSGDGTPLDPKMQDPFA